MFRRVYGQNGNSIIMPRECIVENNPLEGIQAFESIKEWVQEQAVTIGERSIRNTARKLFEKWQHTPMCYDDIVFTLVSTTGDVFYCGVEYEAYEEKIQLRSHPLRRISECSVKKQQNPRKSKAGRQIMTWLGTFINDAQSVRDISENLLPVWKSLQVGGYIVFKFVVPTGNFVFSIGTIQTEKENKKPQWGPSQES